MCRDRGCAPRCPPAATQVSTARTLDVISRVRYEGLIAADREAMKKENYRVQVYRTPR